MPWCGHRGGAGRHAQQQGGMIDRVTFKTVNANTQSSVTLYAVFERSLIVSRRAVTAGTGHER